MRTELLEKLKKDNRAYDMLEKKQMQSYRSIWKVCYREWRTLSVFYNCGGYAFA